MRITRRESLGLAIGLGVGACAPGAVLADTTSEADESLECAGPAERPPFRLVGRRRPAGNPHRLACRSRATARC